MGFWEQVKRDMRKGIKEGMFLVKEGTAVARKRTKKLTKEGRDKFKVYEMQVLVQRQLTELGGRIYDLSSKKKNPLLDPKVKRMVSRLNKLEGKIAAKLERNVKKPSKKAPQKRRTKLQRKTTSHKKN
jgi:hypothetical protein